MAALAAQLLRYFEQRDGGAADHRGDLTSRAGDHGGGAGTASGAILQPQRRAPRAPSAGGGGGGGGVKPNGLTGRLLVMAMWGLARLTEEGHLQYGTVERAASSAEASVGRAELWEGLCDALGPRLGSLPPRELSNAMWALGAVRHCHHPVFGELAAALLPHVKAAAAAGTRSPPQDRSGAGSCNAQVGLGPLAVKA